MSATKILWGQLLFVSVVVVAFLWAATEWTAWRLAFQPQLGPAWFVIGHWPVYQPLAFFIWWFKFDAYAPKIFIEGGGIAASGGIAAMAVAIILSVWRAKEAQNVTTYGSARWADIKEVRRAGLLGPDGVVLGRLGGSYLRHDGPEHVLCFAPTRSGKGVGLVIPTLLTWPHSTVVHDIKGENFQLTSGWRARFGSVLLFDPTNPASAAYNPLLEIRKATARYVTRKISPTFSLIPKGRSSAAIIGKRPVIRSWLARSCMSSTPRQTKRSQASRTSSPIHHARSKRR